MHNTKPRGDKKMAFFSTSLRKRTSSQVEIED